MFTHTRLPRSRDLRSLRRTFYAHAHPSSCDLVIGKSGQKLSVFVVVDPSNIPPPPLDGTTFYLNLTLEGDDPTASYQPQPYDDDLAGPDPPLCPLLGANGEMTTLFSDCPVSNPENHIGGTKCPLR
jgi:hypothetical protein